MKKKYIILCLIPVFFLLIIKLMVIMVVQPSIPMGFYFKSPVRDYKKGDTILFRIDDEYQK